VSDVQRAGWRNRAVSSEFTHLCDTEAGSSGAPVLNGQNELVGLHHLGFDYDMQRCEYLDRENKAVSIAAILDFIRNIHSALHAEVQRWQ
jgi:V8-like Glu-specific endopeptidase